MLTSDEPEPAKHYVGEVAFGYGLLISPTCDMYDQLADEPRPAHPYRVLIPILPLAQVAESTEAVERNLGLLRSRDSLQAYMYLAALDGHFDESVSCLFRPSLVSDEFLSGPPRRVPQMHPEARRQLSSPPSTTSILRRRRSSHGWGPAWALAAQIGPLETDDVIGGGSVAETECRDLQGD